MDRKKVDKRLIKKPDNDLLNKRLSNVSSTKPRSKITHASSYGKSAEPLKKSLTVFKKVNTESSKKVVAVVGKLNTKRSKSVELDASLGVKRSSMADKALNKLDKEHLNRKVSVINFKAEQGRSDNEESQSNRRAPKRCKKQIRKMCKPKRLKPARELARIKKEALADRSQHDKEQRHFRHQEPNTVLSRPWMTKMEVELNNKLKKLIKENSELKAAQEELKNDNKLVKNDQHYKELELEKLTQFWTITREQLEEQRQQAIDLETRMQIVKTAHIEQISLLHKQISMLQLNTRLDQIASTQTDPLGDDAICFGKASVTVQTESEWNKQKISDILSKHDNELGEFIAEIENTKLQAQIDFKFAFVQLEQNLKREHEEELRAVKEEKERQLEEMSRIQCEQLQQLENEKTQMKAQFTSNITDLKVNLQECTYSLKQKDSECSNLLDQMQTLQKQYESMTDKYRVLYLVYERNKICEDVMKKNAKTISNQRNRLEKIEEINEILLGEYKKLEHERNTLSKHLLDVIHMDPESSQVPALDSTISMTDVQNKAYEMGEQVDEIRRKYGGLKL